MWALTVAETLGHQSKWKFGSQMVRERLLLKRYTSANQGAATLPRKAAS